MEIKKKDNRTVIPISVYTNTDENKRWKQVAYSEQKMLSKFVRDVINQYIEMKNKKILWRTNYED